jgi:hypothetical protein
MLAAGCTSVSAWTEYDADAEEAMFLIVADDLHVGDDESASFSFERVDLGALAFEGGVVSIGFDRLVDGGGFGPRLSIDSDELMRPEQMQMRNRRYAAKIATAGDYALMFRRDVFYDVDDNDIDDAEETTQTACFAGKSAVFRLEPGRINVIVLEPEGPATSFDRDAMRARVADVLAQYPNLAAPSEFAELVGTITFERERHWTGSLTCWGADDAFTIIDDGVPATPG